MPPKISILMPVYKVRPAYLFEALRSVQAQTYWNWELIVVVACDDNYEHILHYVKADPRVKIAYTSNKGISGNTNTALALATGEYIALLDHDDTLTIDALQRVGELLEGNPEIDFVYSDEDKISPHGHYIGPYYKPDWSPDTFLSKMYTCHLGVYRTSLVNEIGGFRPEFDGAQDYDLVLRVTEKTDKIAHIPHILYHWRIHENSTAGDSFAKPGAHIAAVAAIREALERRNEPGSVEALPTGMHNVRYRVKKAKKVSIIIPTRDQASMTNDLLNSIFTRTTYSNFEVILVDNGSVEPETEAMISAWRRREPKRFVVHPYPGIFNYSLINNDAVMAAAKGDFLLFLNNDTVVLSPDWLESMVGYAQRDSIGAVGVKLLYPDGRVQHAGVIGGPGGVAGHVFHNATDWDYGYYGRLQTVSNYAAVTAACLMVRREVFEEVGGFDPALRVAFNDVDFCFKLLDAGYRNVYLPFVKLFHYESKSRGYEDTPEKITRFEGEKNIMAQRWQKYIHSDPYYNRNLNRDMPYTL